MHRKPVHIYAQLTPWSCTVALYHAVPMQGGPVHVAVAEQWTHLMQAHMHAVAGAAPVQHGRTSSHILQGMPSLELCSNSKRLQTQNEWFAGGCRQQCSSTGTRNVQRLTHQQGLRWRWQLDSAQGMLELHAQRCKRGDNTPTHGAWHTGLACPEARVTCSANMPHLLTAQAPPGKPR